MKGFKSGKDWNGNSKGRPKGSTTRPQLKDCVSPKEFKKFIERLKERALEDDNMLKFVCEQIMGKAIQPSELGFDEDITGIEITYKKDEDKIKGGEESNKDIPPERTGVESKDTQDNNK